MRHPHFQRPGPGRSKSKMSESLSSLDRLVDAGRAYLMSAKDARMFFNELEMCGAYQILVSRDESEKAGRVKIFVTYEKAPHKIGD
jgi:hypothetical protein